MIGRKQEILYAKVLGETLSYELLETESEDGKEYGIRISGMGDTAEHKRVFTDKKEAQKFLRLLCRCTVTPVTLSDVLTDYLDERDFICQLPL